MKYPLKTRWGRLTHICVGNLSIIGSDNGLSPGRRQAIIWTNAGILFIGPLGTNFNEILLGIKIFSINAMQLKMSSAKWRQFCLGLNELNPRDLTGRCAMVLVETVLMKVASEVTDKTCILNNSKYYWRNTKSSSGMVIWMLSTSGPFY